MLKSTKNALLEVVRRNADPALFEGVESNEAGFSMFTIRLRGSPLSFTVRNPPETFKKFDCTYFRFAPGFPPSGYVPATGFTDLDLVLQHLNIWVKVDASSWIEEVNLPDLWQRLDEENALFTASIAKAEDLSVFDEAEKADARRAIQEFERRIGSVFTPTPEQAEAISAQLQYLSAAVERLNHFDWRSLLLSTVIGVATTLSLDAEMGRQLFEFAKEIFSGALKYLPA